MIITGTTGLRMIDRYFRMSYGQRQNGSFERQYKCMFPCHFHFTGLEEEDNHWCSVGEIRFLH